ncbi:MAG: DNA primase [Flammeovirgaceae bacterium]|nr:DNA primase [Flammeovirgaceae bacterium]MDW8287172.1 DNA primase [Flammeovirgaceae bacterium]
MPISPETIRKVQETADIVEVVEWYLTLKKKGANYWALSPFTQEKTPSFAVSPSKGIYKCFSTGKGGNAISFVMEMEKISFPEAVRFLAKKYNIEIKEEGNNISQEEFQLKESLLIAIEFAAKHYHQNLFSGEGKSIGYLYLKERGFQDKTIEKFQLGYSLNEWEGFKKIALKQGFKEEILEKAGLLVRHEQKNTLYDRFRGRVMFPIHNVSGRVVAFGARGLKKDDTPKYLNSPETEVYQKSEVLYGIFQAKNAIRQKDHCYLTEGYADVISLHQAGIENVVASSGTSLTEGQIKLIKRFTHHITVLYDGDLAGIKAALRGIDLLLASDLSVKVVLFPDGEDADSFVRKIGAVAFQDFIEKNAKNFIEFKAEIYRADIQKNPQKKAELVGEIVASIAQISTREERDEYCRVCEKVLGISEADLQERVELLVYKNLQKKKKEIQTEKWLEDLENITEKDLHALEQKAKSLEDQQEILASLSPSKEVLSFQKKEEEFIRILLLYGHLRLDNQQTLYDFLINEIQGLVFRTDIYRKMLDYYQKEVARGNFPTKEDFLHHIEEDIKQEAIRILEHKNELSVHWQEKYGIYVPIQDQELDKTITHCILSLKYSHVEKLCKENLEALKNTSDEHKQAECLKTHMELLRLKKELADALGIVVS